MQTCRDGSEDLSESIDVISYKALIVKHLRLFFKYLFILYVPRTSVISRVIERMRMCRENCDRLRV